jgi:hypothetical protein
MIALQCTQPLSLHGARVRMLYSRILLDIRSHASSLEASKPVINSIPLSSPLFSPVDTINHVATLKASVSSYLDR